MHCEEKKTVICAGQGTDQERPLSDVASELRLEDEHSSQRTDGNKLFLGRRKDSEAGTQ